MSDSVTEQALNQIIQGKRHLLIKDYYSAVQSFEKVCQLMDNKYGKGANECGDAYLNYGIALLELSRQETGASDGLVNAKINDPSGSEDEDEESQDDDDDDEDDENENENEEKDQNEKLDEEEDVNGKKTDIEEDIANSESEKENDDKEESSIGKENENQDLNEPSTSSNIKNNEDEDEATNIEVAWEVLTTARTIFERQIQEGQDSKLKLSEALQKLGEIAIEWENNEYAIEVLTECLTLRKECLPEDDRLLAETYYHIGNAHSFISQVEKANDCFHRAIDVILKRIENKKKFINETDNKEAASAADTEVLELESLLPEMRARIEDKQDQMAIAKQAMLMEETEKLMEEEVAAKKKKIEDKPVNNVSHLVKRKQTSPGNEKNIKKLCTNNESHKTLDNNSVEVIKSS